MIRNKLKKLGALKESTIKIKACNCKPEKDEKGKLVECECDREQITLREMSGDMRDYYDQNQKDRIKFKGNRPDLNTMNLVGSRAILFAMHVVDDETNELAFDYQNADDLKEISGYSASLVESVIDEAMVLSGLIAAAKDDAEKKSEADSLTEFG